VHHVTYKNMGNEFLWELRAICAVCHERVHDISEADKARIQTGSAGVLAALNRGLKGDKVDR
jgi:hypothetical protein